MPKNILRLFEYALIAFGVVAILFLLATQFERILRAWPSEDYFYFRESAQMLVNGISPYARPRLFYPLYTVTWLFVPLLAGDWTRWVWTLAPIIFLHIALGRKAILLLPFYPLLVHLRFGQVDGWLILPVMFLLRDTKTFAPISAALTLFKPQVVGALVLYRFARWVREQARRNFAIAAITAMVLIAPAFILRPDWVRDWLASIAAHPPEQNQNATIWGWLYFGTLGIPFALTEGVIAAFLVRRARDRASALHLFGLLVTPILYAYDYVLVAPTLKTWRECAWMLAISWLAVGIDILASGWGGAYSLIPLAALALRTEIKKPGRVKFFSVGGSTGAGHGVEKSL